MRHPVFHLHSPSDRMVSYSAGKTDDRIAKVSPFFTCTGDLSGPVQCQGSCVMPDLSATVCAVWKYKEEPGKRLPLGVIYVTLSVAFLITALTILPLFQPLFSLIGKDATLTGSYPVVAADHPGYDQPAYIYRIWIWNVLEGPTGSCHGPSGIFTKFFYGKHDNRRPQCFAGIVDECRSVWSCRVFYGYDHFHHRSRADGMDRLSVQCGVYPVVYGIWLDRTFNVHL